ncbi:MAG: hypothetical protein K8R85_16060 [Bacteroidetes bacterium]|nr:hypothetical protein [Bacteroidota bacterium]
MQTTYNRIFSIFSDGNKYAFGSYKLKKENMGKHHIILICNENNLEYIINTNNKIAYTIDNTPSLISKK